MREKTSKHDGSRRGMVALPPRVAAQTLLDKLQRHTPLEEADRQAIFTLPFRVQAMVPGQDFSGDPGTCALLVSGNAAQHATFAEGRRQFVSFHFPGEWPGQHPLATFEPEHTACALDHANVAYVSRSSLASVADLHPRIRNALANETALQHAILVQAVLNNGLREKPQAVAHLLCELYMRARNAGMCRDGQCPFPLTQAKMAAALGMSIVTMNRTLQELRTLGAFELSYGRLTMHEYSKLAAFAGFDESYLRYSTAFSPTPKS